MTIQFKDIIGLFRDISMSFSLENLVLGVIVETVLVSFVELFRNLKLGRLDNQKTLIGRLNLKTL